MTPVPACSVCASPLTEDAACRLCAPPTVRPPAVEVAVYDGLDFADSFTDPPSRTDLRLRDLLVADPLRYSELPPAVSEKSAVSEVEQPLLDSMLGRYELERLLRETSTEWVFAARMARGLAHQVVLKVPKRVYDAETEKKLHEQRANMRYLSDTLPQQLVRVHDVARLQVGERRVACLELEYMTGGTLLGFAQRYGAKPHTPGHIEEVLVLFMKACRAVDALHGEHQLHRDLKPENLEIDADRSSCKLAGLESVTRFEYPMKPGYGTQAYWAPEVFDGKYSVSTEVFALGASLYHLLAGVPPFVDDAKPAQRRPPTSLRQINPFVPAGIAWLVSRCVEVDPRHRPASAAAVASELARLGVGADAPQRAPVVLARLLLDHLGESDINELEDLSSSAVTSMPSDTSARLEALCFQRDPDELLSRCDRSRLRAISHSLVLPTEGPSEGLIEGILRAVGFLPGARPLFGISKARVRVEAHLHEVVATAEQSGRLGLLKSSLESMERVLDLLVRFYAQALHGSAAPLWIKATASADPAQLTFGMRFHLLAGLLTSPLPANYPAADAAKLRWPGSTYHVLEHLKVIVEVRNSFTHDDAKRWTSASIHAQIDCIARVLRYLDEADDAPRSLQITTVQRDRFGRRVFIARDDRERTVRLHTPQSLAVGEVYVVGGPLTGVVVAPLLFPLGM